MNQIKEENKQPSPFQLYILQNTTTESHSSTVHRSNSKARLSYPEKHCTYSQRLMKILRMERQNRESLPLLPNKYSPDPPLRLYESLLLQIDNPMQPIIKKVKLSQLNDDKLKPKDRINQQRNTDNSWGQSQKCSQSTNYRLTGMPRRQKKKGYERQYIRLMENKKKIEGLFSRYDRYDASINLQEVIVTLRSEIVKSKTSKLLTSNQ